MLGSFFPEREYLRDEWFQKWKTDRKHKYYSIIKQALDAGGDDDAAKAAIRASWEAAGKEAARLGTALHLHCEYDLNGEPLPPSSEITKEIAQVMRQPLECVHSQRHHASSPSERRPFDSLDASV